MRRRPLWILVSAFLAAATVTAGEIHVLPVVADKVPGRNGSLWDTEVRVFSLEAPGEDLVVRRAWVALEGGGFEEDPQTAPEWRLSDQLLGGCNDPYMAFPEPELTPDRRQVMILDAALLLGGVGRNIGAVGLEIEGEAMVMARITNVAGEGGFWSGSQLHFQLMGLGQLVPGQTQAYEGPAAYPWLTPDNNPYSGGGGVGPPLSWRNNLGIVNPSGESLTVDLVIIPYGAAPFYLEDRLCEPSDDNQIWPGVAGDVFPDNAGRLLEVEIPPWGWVQLNGVDYRFLRDLPVSGMYAWNGFTSLMSLNLIPEEDDRPYYTYLSQVYTGVHERNDPAFILPMRGRLVDLSDLPKAVD